MENLRNRINVKLATTRKTIENLNQKPSYILHKIFDNNSLALHRQKQIGIKA